MVSRLVMPAMLAFSIVSSGPLHAAELLMFEQPGCPYCARFDAEIAPGYPDSAAGELAPLRRVDIHEDRTGGYEGLENAVFTPTFVLVDDEGNEVGRLTGYPGDRYFYGEIDPMIAKLPESRSGAASDAD